MRGAHDSIAATTSPPSHLEVLGVEEGADGPEGGPALGEPLPDDGLGHGEAHPGPLVVVGGVGGTGRRPLAHTTGRRPPGGHVRTDFPSNRDNKPSPLQPGLFLGTRFIQNYKDKKHLKGLVTLNLFTFF